MANDVHVRVGVDGEAEYKKELAAMSDQLKVFTSEMQKNTGVFGKNNDSVEALTEKQKTLTKTYEQQQKVVQLQREQLQKAVETYGEGSKQVNSYQIALNKSEGELGRVGRALEETGDKLNGVGSGAESSGEKFKLMGERGSVALEILINSLSRVSGVITNVTKGFFNLAVESGVAADDLNTLSKTTGLSTESLQKFQYASDLIDVSLETMHGAMSRMIRGMNDAKSGTGNAAEAFNSLRVNIKDSSGQLRNSEEVFSETVKALGKIANETERDALAMQIFGRSARELNPLIEGGIDDLKKLGDEASRLGLILDQETIDKANEFNDTLDTLKAMTTQLKTILGAELAGQFQKMIPAFGQFFGFLASLAEVIGKIPIPMLAFLGTLLLAIPALLKILQVGTTFLQFGTLLSEVLDFKVSPAMLKTVGIVLLVTAAIIALIAAISVLIGKSGEFQKTMGSVGSAIGGTSVPRFAKGTRFAPGGLALVGEEGPELVSLPRGSRVYTAAQTQAATGGNNYYFNVSAKDLKEIHDVTKWAEEQRMRGRMGMA
jgi:hypothetical protein